MAGQLYRVIFEGEILEGSQVQEVKRALAKLYNTGVDQVERFFSGKRLAVKKNVDYETAMKYVKAFERAGALCRVEELETHTGLDQPLVLEKDTEEPGPQGDFMVCPQCQFEQPPSEDCLRCGIIISKYSERSDALEEAIESVGPEADSVAFRKGHRKVASLPTVILILSLAAVALVGYKHITGDANVGEISFYTDYDEGLDQAHETGKPVMLVFSAPWCGPCRKMNKEVFSNYAVADASKLLVNIYINVDKADRSLLNKYGIKYIPSVFFLDYSGQTIIRVGGNRSPEDFIENIEYMAQTHGNNS